MLGRLGRIPRMGGGLQGRLPFPSVYRYAMPPPNEPSGGAAKGGSSRRIRGSTSKTPHFLSISRSPKSGYLPLGVLAHITG